MNKFNTVYNEEKNNFTALKENEIARDKARLVDAIKEHFVIASFSDLNEQGRIYYKSLLESMWDSKTGLNKKGIDFINEGKTPLTKETPRDQVKKTFQNLIKNDLSSIIACFLNEKESPKVQEAVEKIKIANPSVRELKEWTAEMICAFMSKNIKIKK